MSCVTLTAIGCGSARRRNDHRRQRAARKLCWCLSCGSSVGAAGRWSSGGGRRWRCCGRPRRSPHPRAPGDQEDRKSTPADSGPSAADGTRTRPGAQAPMAGDLHPPARGPAPLCCLRSGQGQAVRPQQAERDTTELPARTAPPGTAARRGRAEGGRGGAERGPVSRPQGARTRARPGTSHAVPLRTHLFDIPHTARRQRSAHATLANRVCPGHDPLDHPTGSPFGEL